MKSDEIYPIVRNFIADSSNLVRLNSLINEFESDTLKLVFYRNSLNYNFNKKDDSTKLNNNFLKIRNDILEKNKLDIEVIEVEKNNVYFTGYNGEYTYSLIKTSKIDENYYENFKFFKLYDKNLLIKNSKLIFKMNDSLYLTIKKGFK